MSPIGAGSEHDDGEELGDDDVPDFRRCVAPEFFGV